MSKFLGVVSTILIQLAFCAINTLVLWVVIGTKFNLSFWDLLVITFTVFRISAGANNYK